MKSCWSNAPRAESNEPTDNSIRRSLIDANFFNPDHRRIGRHANDFSVLNPGYVPARSFSTSE
jgi:hypothetical protein